jgi:hypothetical protein
MKGGRTKSGSTMLKPSSSNSFSVINHFAGGSRSVRGPSDPSPRGKSIAANISFD